MKRLLPLLTLLVPLVAGDLAEARARRPVKPKLLLTVVKVESATPAPVVLPRVRAALEKALNDHPLVITTLGVKKPTPGRIAWALRRRRLRWFAVTARLESVSHKMVNVRGHKRLVAEAVVSLAGKRKERFRKGTFAVRGSARIATTVSVVLHGEVLASRLAAARAAVHLAVKNAVTQLTTKKKRRAR